MFSLSDVMKGLRQNKRDIILHRSETSQEYAHVDQSKCSIRVTGHRNAQSRQTKDLIIGQKIIHQK